MSPLKLLGSIFGGRPGSQPASRKDAIMFQGFGWESCHQDGWWRIVKSKIPELKQAGCTHIWLPPPSQSVSPQGYMPGQLYNLDASKYGSKDELKALVAAAKAAGIVSIADIVINHRCADEQVDGVWNKYRDDVDHKGDRIDWGQWAITCNDPVFRGQGNPDTGADYAAAPDLDHANPALRRALTQWLQWLKADIGFGGWRFDFVQGYSPEFVAEYVASTVGNDALNVGELWCDMSWADTDLEGNQDAARQSLCNWIDANKHSSSAFDFPTKGVLQEAMRKTQYWRLRDGQGKAPGLIGWWPTQAVTFTDNHDTGSSQQHWPFPGELMGAGYAYILTHPGMPCVFWEHYFDWGPELRGTIDKLIEVRRRNGVVSDSKLEIRAAESDVYFAVVADRVALKLGPRMDLGGLAPRAEDGWRVAAAGRDFCVWEREAAAGGPK